jgi:NADH:ubiquinone oxidoreductase subunit 4 (subunit M)
MSVHLTVLGTPILLVWLMTYFRNKNESQLKWIYRMGILLVFITSLSYFTGPSTADWVKNNIANYPQDLVENHALWGRIAFILQIFSALIGIMAISSYWQDEIPSKKLPYVLALILLVNTIILIYTAHLGGSIRRPDFIQLNF